jgi:hypothetical protein
VSVAFTRKSPKYIVCQALMPNKVIDTSTAAIGDQSDNCGFLEEQMYGINHLYCILCPPRFSSFACLLL